MPFSIPTLADVAETFRRGFRSSLKGSDAWLWPNNVAVSAKVMAGGIWPAFGFIDYVSRQALAQSAEGPWLDRHAAEWGMQRLPASFAEGRAVITGDPAVAVPSGLVLQRADGVRYTTTAGGVTDVDGELEVTVRALVAGKSGNARPGVTLALTQPRDRLSGEAEVAASGIGLGADVEGDESLRARVLFRKRNPPHGGAAHDYVAWAREVAGVSRVFVDPVTATNNRTTVGVWVMMDDLYSNGIPQSADVVRVAAYVDAVRPAGALVAVQAPVPTALAVTIDGLAPDTTEVRDAIRAELADLVRREGRVATTTAPFTLYRSQVDEAISIATGEHHHTLVAPADDVDYTLGQIPVLGTITYT